MFALLRLLPWCALAAPWLVLAWRGGQFPGGDDWSLELARVAAYVHAWRDGQWLPFWAPQLYAGYGSPIFLFYGHGFVAIAALASLLLHSGVGLGFLAALVCAGGIGLRGMQLLASAPSALGPQQRACAGRVAVYLFLLNPYLLADLLVRNAAAEYTALCLVPFVVYGFCYVDADHRDLEHHSDRRRGEPAACGELGWLCLGWGSAAVLVTHLLTTLALAAILLGLAPSLLLRSRRRLVRARGWALGAATALGLSAFVWVPVLVLSPLIRTGDLTAGKFDYAAGLQAPGTLLSLGNAYGAGPLPLCALLLAGWTAYQRRPLARDDATPYTAVLLLCVALWAIQTRWALPLVRHVRALALFQFPFRFMGPLSLLSAWVGGRAFARQVSTLGPRRRGALELLVFGLCLTAALPQLVRVHSLPWDEVTELEQWLAPDRMSGLLFRATARDEYLPRGADAGAIREPAGPAALVRSSPGLRVAPRAGAPRHIVLDVLAPRRAELCLARWAFPFWTLRVDGRELAVTACEGQTLRVPLTAGKHHVSAELHMPRERRWGLAAGAVTAGGCLIVMLLGRARTKRAGSRSRSDAAKAPGQ